VNKPNRAKLDAAMSEAAWQEIVVDLAHQFGWLVAHFRPVRIQRANGSVYYETPAAIDGRGFPDLVLARAGTKLFIELKTMKGRLSAEQKLWFEALAPYGGNNCYVWRPNDYDWVVEILT